MASTTRGTGLFFFGTTALAGYIVVEDASKEDMGDSIQIEDGAGEIVTDISGLTRRQTLKLTLIPKILTTGIPVHPVPGDLVSYEIDGITSANYVLDKATFDNKKKEPSKWSFDLRKNPAIT